MTYALQRYTSIALFILICITSTAYGSDKPSKRSYTPLQVAVLESDTLSPRKTSAESSPQSSISDRQTTLTQEFALAANAGQTSRRSFSECTQNSPRLNPSNTLALLVRAASSPSNSSRSAGSPSEYSEEGSPRSSAIELSGVRPQSPRHSRRDTPAQEHRQQNERTCGDEVFNCVCITAQWSCLVSIPVGILGLSLYVFTRGFSIFTSA